MHHKIQKILLKVSSLIMVTLMSCGALVNVTGIKNAKADDDVKITVTHSGKYDLTDYFGTYGNELVDYMESHKNKYLGTPYGFAQRHSIPVAGKDGHMQCTGFVWRVLTDLPVKKHSGRYEIPDGVSANNVGWNSWTRKHNIEYTQWEATEKNPSSKARATKIQEALKAKMLKEANLKKGDIIWSFVSPGPGYVNNDHHVGFFWGDSPQDDKFWHSSDRHDGSAKGNTIEGKVRTNRISKIEPKEDLVVAFRVYHWRNKEIPQNQDFKVKKVDSDTNKPLEGAIFKAVNKKDGWSVKEDSDDKGVATFKIPEAHVGTFTVSEFKAPSGYKKTNKTIEVKIEKGEHLGVNEIRTLPNEESKSGKLRLTKKLIGFSTDEQNKKDRSCTFELRDRAAKRADDGKKWKKTIQVASNGTSDWLKDIPVGDYELYETKAPTGFETANPKKITISSKDDADDDGYIPATFAETFAYHPTDTDGELEVLDRGPNHVFNVKKVDTQGNPVAGAVISVYSAADQTVNGTARKKDELIGNSLPTDDEGASIVDNLTNGSYYAKETSAPPGYCLDPNEKPFTISDGDATATFVDPQIMIAKMDCSPDHNQVTGAVLGIYDSTGNTELMRWTTDENTNPYTPSGLIAGQTYILKEIQAPTGYVSAAPQTFTIPTDKDLEIDEYDEQVKVKKLDLNGNMISGAELRVVDRETGAEKDRWKTDGTEHYVSNLTLGEKCRLEEVTPAKGYVKAKPQDFDVPNNNTDTEVDMVDKQVFANKKDTKGNLVAGAELRVIDAAGNECDRWTSTADGDGYHAIENLEEGQSYTLEEVKAPNGYVRAKPIRIDVTTDKVNQYYTMVDKRYFLRKVDVDGRLLDNVHAKLAVVKRGDDPKDASKVLDTWYTDDKNAIIQDGDNKGYHAVSNLEEGGQYTVYEVETPKGYVTFKPEDFDVTEEKVDQWRTVIDKRVGVTKTDIGTKTLKDAHLQVIDANNRNVICDQWVTDDSGFWWVSGLEEDHDYILVETKAPYNYVIATEIPFRVTHDSNEKKYNQFLTMKDKQVHVKKQDLGGQEVPGAKMCVIDNDDNNRVVYSWTSGNEETIVQYLREGHHYTFHEEASPDGYVVATDLKFYVNDYKINETYKVTDKRVRALKTDVNHENPIEGAKLSVIDKDSGKTVDTWRTTKDFHYVNNLIEGKTYIMREEEAPKGYVRANDVIFTVSRAKETQSVYMVDKRVKISKKGVKVDSEVEGAKMAIYKSEDGKITDDVAVDTWTTTKDPHYADGLSEGHEYTLVELRAPEGYVKAKPITFIATAASEDGIKADQLEVMIDKRFQVSKTDVTGKKEVPGAHLAVTDAKTGKLIKEWVSTTKAYYVPGLEEGRTYILSETRAPKGYAVAESVQFYITEEKVDQKCIMKDKQVSVTKTDITGTKEVPGAKLEVIDKDTKKTVDKWISGSKKHYVDNLKENHDYILKETRAPKGYVKAEQVEFRVTGEKVNQKHIMKDKQVTVTKTDITGSKEIPGAHLTVTDKKTGRKVDSWISTEKPHNVSGLEEKHTYILTEKLAPKGYVKAESVEFYVSNAKINQKHLMKDKRVFITKTDITTGKELPGAHLSVTDKKTGKVVDRWVSGYHPHAVSGLEEGRRYILKEVTAPNGYLKAESIEFLVTKDKVNQKHVMKDRPYAPKTGDETDATPYIIGAGGAVAVIAAAVIISIIRKKKQK